jgi:hypothetical protein
MDGAATLANLCKFNIHLQVQHTHNAKLASKLAKYASGLYIPAQGTMLSLLNLLNLQNMLLARQVQQVQQVQHVQHDSASRQAPQDSASAA